MSFIKDFSIVSVGSLFSRILGFVRDASIAWLLGAGGIADAFSLALRLPYVGRRMLSEGTLSMSLSAFCADSSQHSPNRLVLAVVGKCAFGVASAILVFAICISSFDETFFSKMGILHEAETFLQICLPYLVFVVVAAGCMAALQAAGRFVLPSVSPVLFNVCMIGTAFYAWYEKFSLYETALCLCWGVLLGGVVQALLQLVPVAWRARREEKPSPECVYSTVKALPSGIISAATPQLIFALACISAVYNGEGSVSSIFYAERILEFPLCLTAASIGIVSAPKIASDTDGKKVGAALSLAIIFTLPAIGGLIAVGEPLIRLLFGHGAFNAQAVENTTLFLYGASPSILAYAIARPLLVLCNVNKSRALIPVSLLSMIASVCSGVVLTKYYEITVGPALGIDIGLCIQAVALWWIASKYTDISLDYGAIALSISSSLAVFGAAAVTRVVIDSDILGIGAAVPLGVFLFVFLMWPARDKISEMMSILK